MKYRALRELVLAASTGKNTAAAVQQALDLLVQILQIKAAGIRIYDDNGEAVSEINSGDEKFLPLMESLQEKLILMLRNDFEVGNLFMTFNRNGTHSLFSYPLIVGDRNIGTVSGVTPGERQLATEEEFIQAISASLAIVYGGATHAGVASEAEIKKARTEAIVETAVAVNHEINNPLTAVLGNVQLLLVDREKLDDRTRRMLQAIEQAALRIKDVTGKLMNTVEPAVTDYTGGIKMVDINRLGKKKPDEGQ